MWRVLSSPFLLHSFPSCLSLLPCSHGKPNRHYAGIANRNGYACGSTSKNVHSNVPVPSVFPPYQFPLRSHLSTRILSHDVSVCYPTIALPPQSFYVVSCPFLISRLWIFYRTAHRSRHGELVGVCSFYPSNRQVDLLVFSPRDEYFLSDSLLP